VNLLAGRQQKTVVGICWGNKAVVENRICWWGAATKVRGKAGFGGEEHQQRRLAGV